MEHVDYLIIGGGIAGITLKHFLKNQNTVLLEAEPGSYKIGESIIPEQFRHPELQKLLPALMKCPSYSPKYGTTFIEEGSAASFPLPEGGLQGAMHITRTEMEQVMLDAWKVPVRHEKVIAIDLEQKIGRVPYHRGRFLSREEDLAGRAQPHDIAHLCLPCASEAEIIQALLEAQHRDNRLRLKGRGAFHGAAAARYEHGEQQHLDVGGEFILAALAGDLHREGQAAAVLDAVQHSACNGKLIGP